MCIYDQVCNKDHILMSFVFNAYSIAGQDTMYIDVHM